MDHIVLIYCEILKFDNHNQEIRASKHEEHATIKNRTGIEFLTYDLLRDVVFFRLNFRSSLYPENFKFLSITFSPTTPWEIIANHIGQPTDGSRYVAHIGYAHNTYLGMTSLRLSQRYSERKLGVLVVFRVSWKQV